MSPERRSAAFSTHPKVIRRGRGLDSSLREERICATARSDPGSETASFTAALTPTLRPRRPSLVRARSVIALPPVGQIRPACHRFWCRGDLTSDTLAGAQRFTALDAGPKAFVVQRRPFGHAAVAWTACRCRQQPVCWAQRTRGVRRLVSARRLQQSRRGRTCLPPTAARRGQCLGGANPCGLAPRASLSGTLTRGHLTKRQPGLTDGPTSSAGQRLLAASRSIHEE